MHIIIKMCRGTTKGLQPWVPSQHKEARHICFLPSLDSGGWIQKQVVCYAVHC